MEEKELQELLNDPSKLLNLFRVFHQLLHALDRKEVEKQLLEKANQGRTNESTGLGDTMSAVVKDSQGNTKFQMSTEKGG